MVKLGRRGFTLVEIMIVVAIIALLAAIAIPNLLRARHNANESAAIASLRTISTAMESFRVAETPPAYPASLATLGAPPSSSPYIDAQLAAIANAVTGKTPKGKPGPKAGAKQGGGRPATQVPDEDKKKLLAAMK